MTARTAVPNSALGARSAVPLNSELFDRRCAELGAVTEAERAELVQCDASTLSRFRRGLMGPRLSVARRFSQILGEPIDALWPEQP